MTEPHYGTVVSVRAQARVDGAAGNSRYISDLPVTIAVQDAARYLRGALLKYDNVADYRRILMAISSDTMLGVGGEPIKDARRATLLVRSELLGACIILRQIVAGLNGRQFEAAWKPYVEEAVIRARLGCIVSAATPAVSKASSILCTALPYLGVALQVAAGDAEQKDRFLRKLSQGDELFGAIKQIYACDPTNEILALLSDWGIAEEVISSGLVRGDVGNLLNLVDALRHETIKIEDKKHLLILGITASEDSLVIAARAAIREGYRWNWLIS